MHITGEEAAAINVGIGAALAWGAGTWNGWRTGRRATRDVQTDRRLNAYSALILALDHLERAWMAGETLEVDVREQEMGAITGSAVREIQKTHMAVLLVGSDEAKQKAKTACDAAWELNDWLRERKRSYTPAMPKLGSLLDSLSDAAFEFVKTAQHELD